MKKINCRPCGGAGMIKVEVKAQLKNKKISDIYSDCSHCDGEGEVTSSHILVKKGETRCREGLKIPNTTPTVQPASGLVVSIAK